MHIEVQSITNATHEDKRSNILPFAHSTVPVSGRLGMLAKALDSALHVLTLGRGYLYIIVVRVMTLPYYRLYYFNTTAPLEKIATLASKPESPANVARVVRAISTWRNRKLSELQFITIACTVLAAAVIGSFSWTTIEEAYWLTHGFWHSSLIFSVLGILLSASEVTVLHLLGPLHATGDVRQDQEVAKKYYPLLLSPDSGTGKLAPRVKMIFTWQAPLMFMSYSVCGFLIGLTVLVCTPLIRDGHVWTVGHNIAIMYLTALAGAGTTFIFCSFWVYHYVQLDLDADSTETRRIAESNDLEGRFGTLLTPLSREATVTFASSSKIDR